MNVEASYNFRRVSEKLTTSGIVPPEGLKSLAAQGYEVVVNLLPDTSEHAVAGEREILESQGIEYIHIPVDFKAPTRADFATFSQVMDRVSERKVHVHCAANYRVTAFYGLYEVDRGGWSLDQAMQFILGVWQPSDYPAWSGFVADVARQSFPERK